MNRRATGTRHDPQEKRQPVMDLAVAEPHAHALGGEHLLLGQRKLDGLIQPVPQLSIFPAEGGVFPSQFLMGRSAAVFSRDGRFYLLSMVVDGLPTALGLLGLLCDRTAQATETCGGIGDPTAEGYLAHGGGSFCVGVWYTTTHLRSIPSNIKRLLAKSYQVSS